MVHSDKSTSVKILSRKTFSSLVERISTGAALATMKKIVDLKIFPLVLAKNSQTIRNRIFLFLIRIFISYI